MGCCCSSDEDDTDGPRPRPRPSPAPPTTSPFHYSSSRGPRPPTATTAPTRAPAPPSNVCNICGSRIDPTLLDGHRETCRARHRQRMAALQQPHQQAQHHHEGEAEDPSKAPDGLDASPDSVDSLPGGSGSSAQELCVVCLEAPRCYAFLPCGHVSCCKACAARLDSCPLCRKPREGLCYVATDVLAQYCCKHCGLYIAPTLYDGHREVCGLRQRQAAAAAAAAARQEEEEECEEETEESEGKEEEKKDNEEVREEGPGALIIVSPRGTAEVQERQERTHEHASTALTVLSANAPPPDAGDGGEEEKDDDGAAAKRPRRKTKSKSKDRTSSSAEGGGEAEKKKQKKVPPPPVTHHLCAECGKVAEHLMICIPCGHRVLCEACVQQRTTCPVCLRNVTGALTSFD